MLNYPSIQERVDVANEHLDLSIKWKGEKIGINEMKRHYANYFRGINHVKEIRNKLTQSNDLMEIKELLESIKNLQVEIIG